MLLLLSVASLATSCVPVLRTSVVRYGVEGRLLDADTSEPMTKRRVHVTVDGQDHVKKTNRSGAFKIPPDRHYYWAWLMGGPYWAPPRGACIGLATDRYTPYQWESAVWPQETPGLDQKRLGDGYIDLGNIEMKRRQPVGPANGRQPSRSEANRTSTAATSRRCPVRWRQGHL